MGIEIERKFLVISETWRSMGSGVPLIQGYLADSNPTTVRVRIAGEKAFLTIKGKVQNLTRQEFEYKIPVADAQAMMNLCYPRVVEKTRYKIAVSDLIWEIDEFSGTNQGLVLAEVELSAPDQSVILPDWVGQEVSDDPRYFNSYLAAHPYSTWGG
ncbi:CYTH domain-containing protein [Acaryochloris sp. IP29b_bin.137]|uniref:CYTH domain-containing protein n=1 Tax=Acaryochloris sp. IP29b_bin.137 TaxID=2969217 RepID=UPI002605E98C|nr:CYTH domain-containing protein [Acaryochloris sp. IP29b_bin.137]